MDDRDEGHQVVVEEESSIFKLADDCDKLFDDICQQFKQIDQKATSNSPEAQPAEELPLIYRVEEFQNRFRAWASYLDVFSEEYMNLDARLRERPQFVDIVLLTLYKLKASLEALAERPQEPSETLVDDGDSSSSSSWGIKDDSGNASIDDIRVFAIECIRESVGKLNRLSIVIRCSASVSTPSDLVARVRRYAVQHLSQDMASLEKSFNKTLQSELPNAPVRLRRQILNSALFRFAKLRYQQWNHNRLVSDTRKAGELVSDTPVDKEPSTVDDILKWGTEASSYSAPITLSAPDDGISDSGTVPVRTSPANGLTICPYCLEQQSDNTLTSQVLWENHIDKDVEPFACLFETCGETTSFGTFEDWSLHLSRAHTDHWLWQISPEPVYRCDHPSHYENESNGPEVLPKDLPSDDIIFPNFVDLLEHFEPDHGQLISIPEADDSESSPFTEMPVCPMCQLPLPHQVPEPCASANPSSITETDKMVKHISNHLREIAFRLLEIKPTEHEKTDTTNTNTPNLDAECPAIERSNPTDFSNPNLLVPNTCDEADSDNDIQNLDSDSSVSGYSEYSELSPEFLESLAFSEMNWRSCNINTVKLCTVDWIHHHEQYKSWATCDMGVLWIKGVSGSGKSTLVSYISESKMASSKNDKDVLILRFFFNGCGSALQKTSLGLFRSLLYQLRKVPNALSDTMASFKERVESAEESGEQWLWCPQELQRLVHSSLLNVLDSRSVWLFVDALDECCDEAAKEFIEDLGAIQMSLRLHICVSSRDHFIIEFNQPFEVLVHKENGQGIFNFVKNSSTNQFYTPLMAISLAKLVSSRAGGVFMWAKLMLKQILELVHNDALKEWTMLMAAWTLWLMPDDPAKALYKSMVCWFLEFVPDNPVKTLYKSTVYWFLERVPDNPAIALYKSMVCWFLERVPDNPGSTGLKTIVTQINLAPGLEAIYAQRLRKMRPESIELFEWICFATRPLSLDELIWVTSLQECEAAGDYPSDCEMTESIQTLTYGLVDVTSDTNIVCLIHQSVKDFLIERGIVGPSPGVVHRRLSRICARYLAMEEVSQSAIYGRKLLAAKFPFLHYATTSWATHAIQGYCDNISGVDVFGGDTFEHFGSPSNVLMEQWVLIYQILEPGSHDCPVVGTSWLHVMSRYGAVHALRTLFETRGQIGIDINAVDTNRQTPLLWAAKEGNEGMVNLLLEQGADAELADRRGLTPLMWATKEGHKHIVKSLLDQGALVYSKDAAGRTSLMWAAQRGNKWIIQLFLEQGAIAEESTRRYERSRLHSVSTDLTRGDTLIFVDLPSHDLSHDCYGTMYTSQKFRVHSSRLLNTGSRVFAKMLGSACQLRTRRQRKMINNLPTGVDYVLDLTPPSEGEALVLQMAELSLTPGILCWWSSAFIHNVDPQLVWGHDDICTCHRPRPSTSNNDILEQGSSQGLSLSDHSIIPDSVNEMRRAKSKSKHPLSLRDALTMIENRQMTTFETPSYRHIPDYCPIRHRNSIIRLLILIEGKDVVLNSATLVWTLVKLSTIFDCASILHDRVTQWIMHETNRRFIEVLPEETFQIAFALELPEVMASSFRILVNERALQLTADEKQKKKTTQTTVFGRRAGTLPADHDSLIQHAALALVDRLAHFKNAMKQALLESGEVGEWTKILVIEDLLANGKTPFCETALARLRLVKEALVKVVTYACYTATSISPMNDTSKFIDKDEDRLTYVALEDFKMSPKITQDFTPIQMLLCSAPYTELGSIAWNQVLREANLTLPDGTHKTITQLVDDTTDSLRDIIRHEPTLVQNEAWIQSLDIPSLQDAVPNPIFSLAVMAQEVNNAMRPMTSRWMHKDLKPSPELSRHLMLKLTEDELKFLPLWAGGWNDGTGLIFEGKISLV